MIMNHSWSLVPIQHVIDDRGCLSVIEQTVDFKFDVKRVFFVSDVTEQDTRGHHAHKELKQIIFATSGSFKIILDNGFITEEFYLEKGSNALFVDGPVWRVMSEFSNDAVMMVLCDKSYSNDIVLRDYDEFKKQL